MSNQTSSAVVFSGYLPIEVTDSDFQNTIETNNSERKKYTPHKSMTRRIGGLLSSSRKKKDKESDSHSVSGFSNTGQQSVVSKKTVDSGITIKASNLHEEQAETKSGPHPSALSNNSSNELNAGADSGGKKQQKTNNNNSKLSRPPRSWISLKRLVSKGRHNKQQSPSVTSQSSSDNNSPRTSFQRCRAKSSDAAESLSGSLNTSYPMRKRFYSEPFDPEEPQKQRFETKSFGGFSDASMSQHAMDQVIRGRLDGIDVLSLGPASRTSLPIASSKAKARVPGVVEKTESSSSDSTIFDPLHISFTNLQSLTSPAKIIDEMIWASAGMDQTEIIFEGFYPGGSDRWGVQIATLPPQSQSQSPPEEQNTKVSPKDYDPYISASLAADNNDGDESAASNTTDNEGSTNLPVADLWDSLWGMVTTPPPIPSYMKTFFSEDEEDQQFAATCNVPIDLDDDAFIIDSSKHVNSIHELVMVPLQARHFDSAISIFEKLHRGLDGNMKFFHLVASTSHNIGMIQLCQGKYKEAVQSFRRAVEIRKECLPTDHPDIAVSLQREGMAHFALGSVVEALKCFEAALAICTSMDNTRAKMLNNIGVARYQLEDYPQALKSFTSALEIQRPWLDGPVRRESIVYSASTILSNMGKVYLREGDHDMAYFLFEEACLMQTSMFRKDHDVVLCSMDNMARAHAKNENYAEALRIFASLHRSQEGRFGPNHEACIETLGMVGISHFNLLDYEEAEKCMKAVESWQIHKGGMGQTHRSVKITTDHLQQIKRCLKEPVWI